MNVIVAKFSTQYKKEGVLFFSLSPGAVEVGHFADGVWPLSSLFFSWVLVKDERLTV